MIIIVIVYSQYSSFAKAMDIRNKITEKKIKRNFVLLIVTVATRKISHSRNCYKEPNFPTEIKHFKGWVKENFLKF
jgi:hypothetical protein